MNIERSIQCVRKALTENPQQNRPDDYIIKLLKISLENNDFSFNNRFYLQIMGTAMGKRFAPALANLYLLDFDDAAMNNFKIKPLAFLRYLDDIFFLWPTKHVNELSNFQTFLNNLIPDIHVTLEHSNEQVNFLDVTIFFSNNCLCTKTFFKPTDTHQLLFKTSHHPKHTFNGLIKSQLIRYKRLSTHKHDYMHRCNILFSSLKNEATHSLR